MDTYCYLYKYNMKHLYGAHHLEMGRARCPTLGLGHLSMLKVRLQRRGTYCTLYDK